MTTPGELAEAERWLLGVSARGWHNHDRAMARIVRAEYDRLRALEVRARAIADGPPPKHSVWPPLYASGRQHAARYILDGLARAAEEEA